MPVLHTTALPTGAKFSRKRAERAVKFIEEACVHTKSAYAGKKFSLYPWQAGSAEPNEDGNWELDGIVRPLFGAVQWSDMHKKWVRQYRMAWLEMARKNGKSELMAALGLYLLIFDGEWSAEVYSAASDREQAAMVFDVARDMVYLSPRLKKLKDRGDLQVIDSRKRIVYAPTRSFYKVVSADAAGNLGANPHGILFDEVLAQPNSDLWDYLRQGFGIRPQPLLIGVTTAGPSRESFAFEEHEFSARVADEPDLDPKRFVFMAFTEEKVDWRDESHWGEANPALSTMGGFLDIQLLRDEMVEILNKGDLSAVAKFKIFRLNQWGTATNLWIDVNVWDEMEEAAGPFTDDDIRGLPAIAGFDLGETMDLTAWAILFYDEKKDRAYVKLRYWITEKALKQKHKKRHGLIEQWIVDGYLHVFDSDVHDYDVIREQMLVDIGAYNIRYFGYDQWQAPAIVNYLEQRSNATAVKIPQLTSRLDSGAKELTRYLGNRALSSNKNPVLRWNVSNAGYKQDSEGHIKPHKENSTGNIDGIAALVNALVVKTTVPMQANGQIFVFSDDDMA